VIERGTVVYVHGASDRASMVDDHVARIVRALSVEGMAFDVVAARWGEAVGPTLDRVGLSIPAPTGAAGPAMAGPPSDAPAAAAAATAGPGFEELLRDGPLSGLALLAPASEVLGSVSNAWPVPLRDADRLLAIAQSSRGADPATPAMIAASNVAAAMVQASPEFQRSRLAPLDELALLAHTAHAVAAAAALQVLGQATAAPGGTPAVDAPAVALAQSLEVRLAETVMALAAGTLLFGYLGVDVGPGLRRWATDVLVPHRLRLMRAGFLGPADILVYQRRGGRIRSFVMGVLADAIARGGPVVALGNSLGGIVLVDALREADAPRPTLLVTVGSQSSLLETVGALDAVETPPFQPWLNMFDRRDFLAFVAQPVWPDQPGITDHAVDMNVGFPDSHGGSYLSEPQVYQAIRAHPALAG
jgi:hypothetical protein